MRSCIVQYHVERIASLIGTAECDQQKQHEHLRLDGLTRYTATEHAIRNNVMDICYFNTDFIFFLKNQYFIFLNFVDVLPNTSLKEHLPQDCL